MQQFLGTQSRTGSDHKPEVKQCHPWMSWIQVHDSSVTASAAGRAGQQLMKFWDSWTSRQERPVGTRMDPQQWKMQCGFLHAWSGNLLRAGMAWLCWQTNESSSLSKAVWEWYACIHAAPKSSSVNRILRELGTLKMLSLLFSGNCCGNCASIFSMEIWHKLPNPGFDKDGL